MSEELSDADFDAKWKVSGTRRASFPRHCEQELPQVAPSVSSNRSHPCFPARRSPTL